MTPSAILYPVQNAQTLLPLCDTANQTPYPAPLQFIREIRGRCKPGDHLQENTILSGLGCGHGSENCWHYEPGLGGDRDRAVIQGNHRESSPGSEETAAVLRRASRGRHCRLRARQQRAPAQSEAPVRRLAGAARIGWQRSRRTGGLPREPTWRGGLGARLGATGPGEERWRGPGGAG